VSDTTTVVGGVTAGFDATAMAVGTNTFNISGTGNTGTITTANGKTFGLGTDYRGTTTVVDNTPTLNLAGNTGTTTGTSPTFNTDTGTTSLTINVNGTTGLNLPSAFDLASTNAITVKGASNLTVYATAALLGAGKITATSPNYSGSLTLVPEDSGALDFSDATSPSTGVRRVNIPGAYNNTITLNELNTGAFTVGVAATSTAAWVVAQAGSGQSDAVTVSFGSAATGSGQITATSIESLTLAGGTAAAGTLTLGAVILTDGAGTQTITITNAGNLAFTSAGAQATFTADTVTATGVAGTLGTSAIPMVLANTAGVSFAGGAGNTFVTGSAAADSITTGIGNDTIASGGGADVINSGAGNDTVTGGAAAEILNLGSGADTVAGGAGIDTIDLGAADAATDVIVFGNETTLTGGTDIAFGALNGADVITNFGPTDDLRFDISAFGLGGDTEYVGLIGGVAVNGSDEIIILTTVGYATDVLAEAAWDNRVTTADLDAIIIYFNTTTNLAHIIHDTTGNTTAVATLVGTFNVAGNVVAGMAALTAANISSFA